MYKYQEMLLYFVNSATTVSYTHLDVYKRQVDRGAITGKGDSASKLFDNEVMNKTEVAKNGNIVYLNSVIWYTMTGGIESTNQMIDEIADAIK